VKAPTGWHNPGVLDDDAGVDEQLLASLMAVSRALVAMAASSIEASPVEITLNQYRALVVLASRAPIPMVELARELALSPSSLSRLVDRLERKGLVRRAPSSSSRRSTDLRLEPAGEALVAAVMVERRRQFVELLSGLPPRGQAGLRRSFEAMARIAGEPVAVPPVLLGLTESGT